jgi:DHA1 family bicyclomycin/chloramphenicol resistance-like MFS transporter
MRRKKMKNNSVPGTAESIALYASLTAVTALSLDIILPVYALLGDEFGLSESVDLQGSILLFIGGMLIGELLAGPLADHCGRRMTLAASVGVFSAGTLACLFAPAYEWLLVGRVLQGVGAAGQKICTRAIIRDRYSGAAMARIMSYVLAIFVALPFIAPALGSVFAGWLGWRSVFMFLGCYAVTIFIWYWWRHPETLPRDSLSTSSFVGALHVFFRHKRSVLLTFMAGLLFGIHLAFISLSPLLFADIYRVTQTFPIYFGCVACAFGAALIFNARYVTYFGMEKIIAAGLAMLMASQIGFLAALFYTSVVPFAVFLALVFVLLFSLGLIFGNLTALILQPLGRLAGVGSAVSSALSSAIALLLSLLMGIVYEGSLLQFILPSSGATLLAMILFVYVNSHRSHQ